MIMNKKLMTMLAACVAVMTSCGNAKVDTSAINGKWMIEEAMGVSTETADTEAFVDFDGKGKVNGNASVNTFFGTYKYDGKTFKFDNIGMTQMLGASMDVEDAVTKAINSAAAIEINGDKATVKDNAGETVMSLIRK